MREPELVAVLEEAIERLGESDFALRARLCSHLAALVLFFDAERYDRLAEEAVAAARRTDDPLALARALQARMWQVRPNEDEAARREQLSEAHRFAELAGDRDMLFSLAVSRGTHALSFGDPRLLDLALDDADRLARAGRSPVQLGAAAQFRGTVAILRGEYDQAEADAEEMLGIGRRLQDRGLISNYGVTVMPLRREQGRLGEFLGPTRAIVEALPEIAAWRSGLAQLLAIIGDRDGARAELEVLGRDRFGGMANDVSRPYTLAAASEAAALVGEVESCRVLLELMEALGSRGVGLGPTAYHGVTDRYVGMLALALGRAEDAVSHLETAIGMLDAFEARSWVARTRFDLARALLARDADGDRSRALSTLNASLDAAHDIGMPALVEEVLAIKLDLQGIASGSSPDASIDAVAASVSRDRPDLDGVASCRWPGHPAVLRHRGLLLDDRPAR